MAREFIPSSVAECTPEWLNQVLGKSGVLSGARIEKVDAELLGEGEGFIGTIARLHLQLDRKLSSAPASVIVKVPTSNRAIKAQGEMLGLYEREIFFYDEFASKLPNAPPRCFHSAMDPNFQTPENQQKGIDTIDGWPDWLIRLLLPVGGLLARLSRRRYVMLLEDMAPARVGDQLAGGTGEEIEAMLLHLGRMHARFWNSQELLSKHWLPSTDTASRSIRMMYRRALPGFLNVYGDRLSEKFRALQRWLNDNVLELVQEFQRAPFTLVHADFRLDNVFFKGGDEEGKAIRADQVVLFDWQTPSRGPGAYDLSYFLSSTLAVDTSPAREESLIQIYHQELLRSGVENYDFEALQFDYRRGLALMVQRTTAALAEIETTNDRGKALFEIWVDRLSARVEDLDLDSLLPEAAG